MLRPVSSETSLNSGLRDSAFEVFHLVSLETLTAIVGSEMPRARSAVSLEKSSQFDGSKTPRAGWSDTFRLGHRQIFGYPGFDRRGRAIRGMPAHPDANLFSVDARPVRARADGLRPLLLGITRGLFVRLSCTCGYARRVRGLSLPRAVGAHRIARHVRQENDIALLLKVAFREVLLGLPPVPGEAGEQYKATEQTRSSHIYTYIYICIYICIYAVRHPSVW